MPGAGADPYETDLDQNAANHQPLSPLSFLSRTALAFPDQIAVVHGARRYDYATLYARCRRLGSALARRGFGRGDTVSVLAPNVPAMIEAHYGVPMCGAVLNTLNTRLDAPTLAFMLDHADAKVLIVDKELSGLAREVLLACTVRPLVVDLDDALAIGGERIGDIEYEHLLEEGDPDWTWQMPGDEWNAISLNYTSGTTGNPKGVVYHHRGAYLTAIGNVLSSSMPKHPVYLWTLPMFHCNGWCYTWTITLLAGTHVCLRRLDAGAIYDAIVEHGVSHLCGAPIVMGMLINATAAQRKSLPHPVSFTTAAAPPPASVIARMEDQGFRITHVYGLTETYGPAVVNEWHREWDALEPGARAAVKARQGIRYATLEDLSVRDAETLEELPWDGETMGEVMFRGNIVMKGYLKNRKASDEAFAGGWFHSGDLGVRHPDGYIQLRDRSKDIIISGGENISSIEIEDVLYRHPAIAEAAVVARPDEKWGETPCAFVGLKADAPAVTEAEIIAFCRDNLAHFKCPRHVVFLDLPKTSTGKIQKFKLRDLAKDLDQAAS